jgi:molybdopterin/thiamine biosynthesis adenylyltransferase
MRVFDYDSAFRLNYGVFSPEQQERLRKARVTMLGVGGAGGTIAVILARSGIESFCLIDPDRYSEGNLNRQIGCFVDTLGQFKAEVIQREILRINPAAQVAAYPKVLSFDELATLIEESEVFLAEADDLAFSSRALVLAQERKKLAVTLMPTGFTCYVAVFPPDLTRVIHPAELFGAPTHDQGWAPLVHHPRPVESRLVQPLAQDRWDTTGSDLPQCVAGGLPGRG